MTKIFILNLLDKGIKELLKKRTSKPCGHKGLRRCAWCEVGFKDGKSLELAHEKSFELFEGNFDLNF